MKVLKRKGFLEDFDINKLIRSMANASDEANQPLNQGDLTYLSKLIAAEARENYGDTISHYDLRAIVDKALRKHGFSAVADSYARTKQ